MAEGLAVISKKDVIKTKFKGKLAKYKDWVQEEILSSSSIEF